MKVLNTTTATGDISSITQLIIDATGFLNSGSFPIWCVLDIQVGIANSLGGSGPSTFTLETRIKPSAGVVQYLRHAQEIVTVDTTNTTGFNTSFGPFPLQSGATVRASVISDNAADTAVEYAGILCRLDTVDVQTVGEATPRTDAELIAFIQDYSAGGRIP